MAIGAESRSIRKLSGDSLASGPECPHTAAVSSDVVRTLDQVRETIGSMPFVQAAGLEIEFADEGVGVVSIPLSSCDGFRRPTSARL